MVCELLRIAHCLVFFAWQVASCDLYRGLVQGISHVESHRASLLAVRTYFACKCVTYNGHHC